MNPISHHYHNEVYFIWYYLKYCCGILCLFIESKKCYRHFDLGCRVSNPWKGQEAHTLTGECELLGCFCLGNLINLLTILSDKQFTSLSGVCFSNLEASLIQLCKHCVCIHFGKVFPYTVCKIEQSSIIEFVDSSPVSIITWFCYTLAANPEANTFWKVSSIDLCCHCFIIMMGDVIPSLKYWGGYRGAIPPLCQYEKILKPKKF